VLPIFSGLDLACLSLPPAPLEGLPTLVLETRVMYSKVVNDAGKTIVLFDGVCNLCNGVVQFIITNDQAGVFQFASQQSEAGKKLLEFHQLPAMDTVVLIEGSRVYTRSDAVLEIMKSLPAKWSWLSVFKVVPKFLRDAVYKFIGRYRYNIFGKRESCWLPTPELRARFLDAQ
jgi:predicted DCC family thiol-disulfide oxidoreductase YuxK